MNYWRIREQMAEDRAERLRQLNRVASVSAETFTTLTGESWKRSLAEARATPNSILAQMRSKLSGMSTLTPGSPPALTADSGVGTASKDAEDIPAAGAGTIQP